jgi:ribosomal-protein-alanine N-acetyltransferase
MLTVSFSPFPIINTERLLLRAIVEEDAAQLLRLRSDERSMKYLDRDPMQNLEEASLFIKKITDDLANVDGITWAISLKESPTVLIGTIGFWKLFKENYRAEIGYMLMAEYFRNGLMGEAIKAVIAYGFNSMRLHTIKANINPANEASRAILESNGFIKEAFFREDYFYNGRFINSEVYGLLHLG